MAITRLLIANRAEIAVRVVRACRDLGIETVLAVSEADRGSLASRLADRTVCVGPASPGQSYLNIPALLTAALETGCDAVHPGYGFLSENADFVEACTENGLTFVGPSVDTMRLLGDKLTARTTAAAAGIPIVPGGTVDADSVDPQAVIAEVGLPLLVKAAAGGGGRGLRRVDSAEALAPTLAESAAEARAAFGDATLYVERYLGNARHIEVQVFGDQHGNVVHLFERDCTTQRRYQKLLEEAPSPVLDAATRARITDDASLLARKMGYEGAGTVEFLYDTNTGEHFFIEMNTRLQVEHPVTEVLTGLDLVTLQLRVAAGEPLPMTQDDVRAQGHVIEFRVNSEDAHQGFRPAAGPVDEWRAPAGPWVRVDTHVEQGHLVSPFYDSLLAKLIVSGRTREEALARARRAVREFKAAGVPTTLPFHEWLLDHPDFINSTLHTTWVDSNWKGSTSS
ncbi:acetyl-CoA carboxylase biotin carboxylase subunit [Nocardioides sp. LHG3406-4]|uniref:acetyl-CoA carboxylase biotin carboxylase subunit n=1 Tax=Nocardioides sp. LHG3406-4 TaxID=2804575 RepID=UPI003CE6EE8C